MEFWNLKNGYLIQILYILLLLFSWERQFLTVQSSQCHCIQISGTNACLPYDPKYQAFTVEDAIANFPDLSIDKPPNPVDTNIFKVLTANQKVNDGVCVTNECRYCQTEIRNRLAQVGLTPYMHQTKKNNISGATLCNRYRFGRKEAGTRITNFNKINEYENNLWKGSLYQKYLDPTYDKPAKRVKKETQILGQRYFISCTTRGVSEDAGGMLILCSTCWAWRMLPSNYYPALINELICDVDTVCLSGYGSCATGYRTVDVLRNDSGHFTSVTVDAGSFCECRVPPGSALQGLITGCGTSSALPAIT